MNIVDIQHSFQHFSNCWAKSNILHITNCDNKISKFYWTEIPGDLIKGKFHLWAKYEKHSKYPHLSWEVALCNPTWSDLAHRLPPKFAVFTQASTEGRREGGREGGRLPLGKARKVPIWRQKFSQAMLCHNLWFSRPLGLVMPVLL